MINKTILATAMLVCVALASAQGGQGGGQGRGGRGGIGFGQGQRGGAGSELQLAFRKDVQTDLGVTAEQKTKLDELQAKQRQGRNGQARGNRNGGAGNGGAVGGGSSNSGAGGAGGVGASGNGGNRGNRGGGQGLSDADREAMQKRMQEQREQARKDLSAILNEAQMKRLGEIRVQLQGTRAVLQPEIQKELGITAEQVTKLQDLQEKQRQANQALMEKMRNQELSREDAMKSFENNNKALDTEMLKVLTTDQANKLKAMGGKPFKADPPQRGGGGR